MLHAVCQWLEATPVAQWISESSYGFPSVETVHVLALTTVVGTILIVDMRLLNFASTDRAVRALNAEVLPLTWSAFAVAVVSGGLLFTSKATQYVDNLPFRLKTLALVMAGLNMLVFHHFTYRKVDYWDTGLGPPPRGARIAGALSLLLWACVIVCGRWIGFTTH